MANWRSIGDQMLYCHRSLLKIWSDCSNPANFNNSSTGGGGLVLGGGCFKKAATFLPIRRCSSSSPPVSTPRSLSSSPLLMLPPSVVVDNNNSDKYYYSDEENNNNNDDYFNFFSLLERSQFRVRKNLRIPWQRDLLTPDAAPCVGSSHGWLAFNHPRNCHPYLYNPLIDSHHFPYIPLPSVETLPSVRGVRFLKSDHHSSSPSLITQFLITLNEKLGFNRDTYERNLSSKSASRSYLAQLVMSSAPSVPCYSSSLSKPELDDNDCTIVAINRASFDIAFCKPGDDSWTALDGYLGGYSDIIYFSKDQRFYAMRIGFRSIEAWDLRDPSCPKNQVFDSLSRGSSKLAEKFMASYNCAIGHYLVESSGDLLLLSRFIAGSVAEHGGIVHPRRLKLEEKAVNNIHDEEWENYFIHDDDAYWTVGFDVEKLDFDHNKWEPVDCLGDRALFVGSNQSFSLSTRDYPELMGNSIYFTDDNFMQFNNTYHGHDNGVFHLGDKGIKPYYPSRLKIIDPPPVWVAPNTM